MRGRDVWRLNPEPDVQDKATLEPAALSAIEQHFGALGDPRFGVVRVLDRAPELQTFVMEAVGEPLLASLFLRQALLRGSARGAPLTAVFENAGAWLREFHTLPPPSTTITLRPDVESLVASIERAGVYLADSYRGDAFFTRAAASAAAAARDSLPAQLPLVVSHGDYAPWNVFVGPAGRVTVFDTFATWRVPRLEDVAFFLFCLRTPWPRVYSQGLAVNAAEISRPSEDFLRGYFQGEAIPWRQIRIFEVQCVLSRWASRVHGVSASRGVIRLGKRVRLALLGRSLRLYLQDLVTELEGRS
jgi:aminoglycoside phosphotransferase (APT) family kinase protein